MRKIFLYLSLIVSLNACSINTNPELDYADFESNYIQWENLLMFEEDTYVYIYSDYCGHCKDIKQEILSFGKGNIASFYLIEFCKEIPLGFDPYLTENQSDLSMVFIVGTPTLIEVKNHTIIHNFCGAEDILYFVHFLE